jgi:hypothetical protein
MDLSFTIAAVPRQRSHSRVRVPRDSLPYFTVSDSRLPHPGGPGPRIYVPQEQGGPVIPPGTGYPIRRLLRLGHAETERLLQLSWLYLLGTDHIENTVVLLLLAYSLQRERVYEAVA